MSTSMSPGVEQEAVGKMREVAQDIRREQHRLSAVGVWLCPALVIVPFPVLMQLRNLFPALLPALVVAGHITSSNLSLFTNLN